MPGDYSRRTYNPNRDTVGVYEQQGRVRLDANLNEFVDLIDRRLRATSLDTLGPAVVPVETPDGFAIAYTAGKLTIGSGRAYVDGIEIDNHGRSLDGFVDPGFEPRLEELRGRGPIPFDRQPYVPAAPSPFAPAAPGVGTYLAYLDVFHRERTWAEDASLLDPALYGIDTATRRQAVWQVRFHDLLGGAIDCSTPDSAIPNGWSAIVRPSAARLTTNAVGVPVSTDPCDIPPAGGFRGIENRLYRVEIHDPGAFGTATFCWSRDDASLASPVTSINGATIGIVRPGRDQVVRFATGDWVEVTDDDRELSGLPGHIAKVGPVDDVKSEMDLAPALPAAFATAVNPRVRRWDQRPATIGTLPVTAAPVVLEDGVQVTFTLDPAIAGGTFRTGEYWVFAARVADGSVEQLAAAPPVGPHHHIARLAVVDGGTHTVTDCRTKWPCPCGGDGGCDCDACVTANSHNSGAFTIQDAVTQVAARGGTICLGPGIFRLRRPVEITNANAVRIRGKGWTTIVITPGRKPAFVVQGCRQITIQDLTVLGSKRQILAEEAVKGTFSMAELGGTIAIGVANTIGMTVERCILFTAPVRPDRAPTLATLGVVVGLTVRECVIVGVVGIGNPLPTVSPGKHIAGMKLTGAQSSFAGSPSAVYGVGGELGASDREQYLSGRLLMAHWNVIDNLVAAGRAGVALLGAVVAAADNRFARNDLVALIDAGIAIATISLLGTMEIDDNIVASGGFGILCGTNTARITDNTVIGFPTGRLGSLGPVITTTTTTTIFPGHVCGEDIEIVDTWVTVNGPLNPSGIRTRAGIVVVDPLGLGARLRDIRIVGNDVNDVVGLGIAALSPVRRLLIDANHVVNVVAGGIVTVSLRSESVVISANVVERVRGADIDRGKEVVGLLAGSAWTTSSASLGLGAISVLRALRADAHDNIVNQVATSGGLALGITFVGVRSGRIVSNRVQAVGDDRGAAIGVLFRGPFGNAEAIDNEVIGRPASDESTWIAIRIDDPEDKPTAVEIGQPAQAFVPKVMVPKPFGEVGGGANAPAAAGLAGVNAGFVAEPHRDVPQLFGVLAAVRGNTVEGGGRQPAVLVRVRGNAMFNDNRVRYQNDERRIAVEIAAVSALLNANYIELSTPFGLAINADVNPNAVATSGNVTNGVIVVAGSLLGSPWDLQNISA